MGRKPENIADFEKMGAATAAHERKVAKIKGDINLMLNKIAAHESDMRRLARDYENEIAPIQKRYAEKIREHGIEHSGLVKELIATARKFRNALFKGGDDRLDLDEGSIIYQLVKKVIRRKTVKGVKTADYLEGMARLDLVKTVKSVDWDQVEKLSDGDLGELGLERKGKDFFSYEVKG